MTAPTQPPDPRVQMTRAEKIKALDEAMIPTGLREMARERFATVLVDVLAPDARVLVEELGGRERETVQYQYLGEPAERPTDGITLQNGEVITWRDKQWHLWDAGYTRTAWYLSDLIQCVTFCCSDNDLRALLALQQRENAETIKALKERVETAEAANTELDNARKSAEQSARDLRENNATLRAELDAIKGAQKSVAFAIIDEHDRACGLSFGGLISHGGNTKVVPLYRHPAPALPVVGACVFNKDGQYIGTWSIGNVGEQIKFARQRALGIDGTAYRLYRDVTPLPTEGGK